MQTRETYVQQLKSSLDVCKSEIDVLEAKARLAGAQEKRDLQLRMAELRKKRGEADSRLKDLQDASGEAWKSLREGTEVVWEDLKDTLRTTKQSFQQEWQRS
ncbi:MAG: hypothetical protein R3F17_06155 [Planctomycetota bacterium]